MLTFNTITAHEVVVSQFILKPSHDSNTNTVEDVEPADML